MTPDELLLSFLTKVYNKTEDEVKGIIFNDKNEVNENAFETLSGLDTIRVKRLKSESTEKFNNGYSKGKEETASEFEKLLKETFSINDELPFAELLPKVKELSTTKSKMSADDVKKHPEYLALETSRVPKAEHEKLQTEFETFKKGIERRVKIDKVKEKAILNLDTFNPDYPDVPQIKQNLVNVYLNSFDNFDDFEFAENSIIAIKDGKRVEDAHGNPVTFDKLCKETASGYFKFKVTDARSGAGNSNGGSNGLAITLDRKELQTEYSKLTDDTAKKAFLEKYKGQF